MTTNKKIKTTALLVSLIFSCSIELVAQVFSEPALKFGQFLNLVNSYYVDTVNQQRLVDQAIVNLLKQMDPHSTYIDKKDVRATNEPLEGNFEGIGISYTVINDTVFITSVHQDGPAEKEGVKAGDRLMTINMENIAGIGIKVKGIKERLQGNRDSGVKIGIWRKGEKKRREFVLIRQKIPIKSVESCYMVSASIGYIKLTRFSASTLAEFKTALQNLKKNGISKLILDLRDNGGGYLNVAIAMADEFLSDDKRIVYTEGLNSPKTENKSEISGNFENGSLAVLIDEGSASASEILAGAIQDWDRGVIIGRRSFGKGLVQRSFPLRDGSMVRLTIAKYYTPTGRSIQKPYDKGEREYRDEIRKRFTHGEMTSADSIHFPDSLKYSTLQNQRTVFGGGGIMPDVFVPMDTSRQTPYYTKLLTTGILNNYVVLYLDNNRKKLKKAYSNFEKFDNSFVITNDFLEKLFAYAETQKLPRKADEIEISRSLLTSYLKATIASYLWSNSEFYQIINRLAAPYTKAIEILDNDNLYSQKLCSK
jgi:carboxyl-terminal processing protease